jgi:hypothetical protein
MVKKIFIKAMARLFIFIICLFCPGRNRTDSNHNGIHIYFGCDDGLGFEEEQQIISRYIYARINFIIPRFSKKRYLETEVFLTPFFSFLF